MPRGLGELLSPSTLCQLERFKIGLSNHKRRVVPHGEQIDCGTRTMMIMRRLSLHGPIDVPQISEGAETEATTGGKPWIRWTPKL